MPRHKENAGVLQHLGVKGIESGKRIQGDYNMNMRELQEKWGEETVDCTDFQIPEDERREIVPMGDYEMEGWSWVW